MKIQGRSPPFVSVFPMPYLLKLLSGTLAGVDYRLAVGDTVFHIGPQSGLEDGTAGQLLASSENAFYIPDASHQGAFRVQVAAVDVQGEAAEPILHVRDESGQWRTQPLPLQQVVEVVGLHLAVRDAEQPWAATITGFDRHAGELTVPAAANAALVSPSLRPRRALAVAGLAVLLLAATGALYYHQHQPDAQVRGLAGVLQGAPTAYQVVAGNDDRLHVFAANEGARSWAERASRRLDRDRDVHRVRSVEARRLEQQLLAAGLDVVVVRLDDARQPQIVLSGIADDARQRRVQEALAGQAPYAAKLVVSGISDQQLLSIARGQLATLGIPIQTVPSGSRVSVLNASFLDDAGLQAMSRAALAFHHQWGQRRLTIQPQLWDDLLQDRSYRYSPGQLVSIGEGRWQYAGAIGTGGHAAP